MQQKELLTQLRKSVKAYGFQTPRQHALLHKRKRKNCNWCHVDWDKFYKDSRKLGSHSILRFAREEQDRSGFGG